jgi:hypothetical protein
VPEYTVLTGPIAQEKLRDLPPDARKAFFDMLEVLRREPDRYGPTTHAGRTVGRPSSARTGKA